jgi:regulator of sigma E protease
MDYLTNTAAFIVVLGLVIFFHEFGHFITAKAFRMRVFIFSFGFGKRLLGFKWGDTDCRLSAIPLGGYVKLEGEPDDIVSPDQEAIAGRPPAGDSRDFTARPRWQRFIVYLAGPAMNGVLAVGLLTLLFMMGFQVDASLYDKPVVGAVEAGSPAAAAGFQPGDEIVAIDGRPMETWEDAQFSVILAPATDLRIQVRRAGREQDLAVRSGVTEKEKMGTIGVYPLVRVGEVLKDGAAEAAGLRTDDGVVSIEGRPIRDFGDIPEALRDTAGRTLTMRVLRDGALIDVAITPRNDGGVARIGIAPKRIVKQFTFLRAVKEAWRWTASNVRITFRALKGLLTAKLSPKSMMGPLGIAQESGNAARQGYRYLLLWVAVISVQIGIFNLFPLFPLDGGHLAILATESVIRRDLSLAMKERIGMAGLGVLVLLIGVALYSDLGRTKLLQGILP